VKTQQLASIPDSPRSARDIIDERELLRRVPVSRRTLQNWRLKGVLPFIRLPRARRVLYDWELVRRALNQ